MVWGQSESFDTKFMEKLKFIFLVMSEFWEDSTTF